MNKALEKIPALVTEELEAANNIHSLFHSAHEGYAVLLEEVEEAEAEMESVKGWMRSLWTDTKEELGRGQSLARGIEWRAVKLAAEAIQVAAMARKFQDSLGGVDE
jgi:hypothetical protein